MRISTDHNLYEVYSDWDADAVIVDHMPTEEELKEIVKLKNWCGWDDHAWEDIKGYIDVFKVEIITND